MPLVAVSVEVCAVELLKVSDDEERPHVVGLEAPEGEVTAQVSATVPVNELDGVTVMVEVPDELALNVRLVGLLESVKLVLPLGASQKSPQPAKPATNGETASNNHARIPIFIAAPLAPFSAAALRLSPRRASCLAATPRARALSPLWK